MSRVNKAVAPYYDDYNSSKQYTQLLAIPGRVAQAREITQIQSTIKDIVKSIGDSILKDGNVIEGCQIIVNSEKTQATITAGKVYINGMVLPVKETIISISGVGNETIGFKLVETLITEDEDSTLRDPAQGYDNFNQAGCHRIKSDVVIVKDDPDSAILVTLIDGAVAVEKYAPDYDILTQTLARRTYDESGSYIVSGLNVRIESNNTDDTKFNVVVESGKAYVLGYELRIPAPRRITLPRADTYSSVTANNYWYDSSISSYELSNAPYVRDITSVKGFRSKTVNQTISSNTDRVLLDELEISQITEVKQGIVTYTIGTDCYLQREGTRYYLKWNGTEKYPTLNTSYSVTYTYNHTFLKGIDYELSHNIKDDSHNLTWKGADTPLNSTNFTVVYDQYLARKDIVYIDQYGNISVIQGTPAEYGFEIIPEAPVNTLALASIMSPPNGEVTENLNLKIEVSNVGLTRFTMNDIQRLLDRIRTIEYDQSILSLNEEARQYETESTKRGIFTDPIIDLSKIDYYYNLSNGIVVDPSLPKYDVTIDLDSNLCYLPTITDTYDATVNTENSTSKLYTRTATLSKTGTGESVVLAQMNATKSFLINPYSVFPQLPEISISPAVDVWIEDSIITVPVSQNSSEVVTSSTRHIERNNTSGARRASTTTSNSKDTAIGTRVETFTNESVIEERSINYIRRREIEVEGSQFPPHLDNIIGYFDGLRVNLTPLGSTTAGTETGTVKADSTGSFHAKFKIPEKVLTGIREIRMESSTKVDGYESSAFALYQASGTSRTIQRTVTTLTTVLLNRVTTITTTNYIDPVGQTFVLDRMTIISGIDLYFESKPEGRTPVTCEIREVLNGNITSTVYGHKTLSATEVQVSSDSTIATRFTFDDPVLLEENKEYAFVVRSTSDRYRVWVADLGGSDILTGETVLSNPYLIGVMLSSSNNSSWTAHQTTDIKFRLIEDTYSNSSEIVFNEITGSKEFSRISLLADSVVPNGTSISWYYSLDAGTTYTEIAPYNIAILDQMKSSIVLKAILKKSTSSNLSPIIAIDSVGATLSSYDTEGYYITRNITGLDEYTNVDVVLDTHIPSSTTLEVYVSTGGELVKANLDSTSSRNLNYGWREQTYKVKVPKATQCRVFIKLASIYNYFTPSFRRVRVIMS